VPGLLTLVEDSVSDDCSGGGILPSISINATVLAKVVRLTADSSLQPKVKHIQYRSLQAYVLLLL
jgi:hypothetical protein